jgi:carboxypeptidase Taq
VLLDEYEPGATSAGLTRMFSSLAQELAPLVKKIVASPRKPRAELLQRSFPREKQEEFGRLVARDMGFDFDAGRLDVSAHPFCSGFAPSDVRITTRYKEDELTESLFGIMHEAGHGLYEQGLDATKFGTPLAEACSTGVHESQSRLWENLVGRSRPFWRHYYPKLRALFPAELADASEQDFLFAINLVTPSLIRTESDEVTYNLHIIVRFEIERDLLSGKLPVAELPRAWNAKYEELLGITPPKDSEGCLQDVHWSIGLFGYFPTYTLGNLYAAQLFTKARAELGLDARLERGELGPLRSWLREKVHRKGMFLRPNDLITEVTGKPPSQEDFVSYLKKKYGELYGI